MEGKFQPLVSIIVPIYNGEKTLKRCTDSILNQNFENFELILVNDGSSDGSSAICHEIASEDNRVRVADIENSGVSAARNTGMKLARGKYFQFADCDDWIAPEATRLMTEKAEALGCDMLITDFYRVVDGKAGHKGGIPDVGLLTRTDYASYMMKEPANFYYGVMWNKLYKKEIIIANGLSCSTELNWCEDFLFNLEYIRCAETFGSLEEPTYYYVKSESSLVEHEATIQNTVKMKIEIFSVYKELYESMDIYEKNRLKVMKFLISIAKDTRVQPEGAARRKMIKGNIAKTRDKLEEKQLKEHREHHSKPEHSRKESQ